MKIYFKLQNTFICTSISLVSPPGYLELSMLEPPNHGAKSFPYLNGYLMTVIHITYWASCNTHRDARLHFLCGAYGSHEKEILISPPEPQTYTLAWSVCCCYCFKTRIFIPKPRKYQMPLLISTCLFSIVHLFRLGKKEYFECFYMLEQNKRQHCTKEVRIIGMREKNTK